MKTETYYSWECPPRILRQGKWLDYNVDLEKIFQNKKIDKFTELPKVIEFQKIEKEFLKSIKNQKYYKLIADTNAYYLSTATLNFISKEKLQESFNKFKILIQEKCDKIYGKGKVKVILFTDLIKDNLDEYEKIFFDSIDKIESLVSKTDIQKVEDYLKEHIGIEKENILKDFTKKVLASYIAEGVVIPKILKNPVWINFDEPSSLTNVTNTLNNGIKIKFFKKNFPNKIGLKKN